MKLAKQIVGFVGILAMFGSWGYFALTWPGPKPAWMYVYVPIVVCLVIGAAIYGWWTENSN